MKFRNMQIGTQLHLSLGAVLVFVLLLGGLAWVHTDLLWLETKGLYEHPLQVRRAVGELKYDIAAIHRDMKDLILAGNDAERANATRSMAAHEADARRQLDIVFDRYLGPRQDVEAAFEAFNQWNAVRAETIRLLHAGRQDEAMGRTKPDGEGGRQARLVLDRVMVISDFARNRGDRFFQDATDHNRRLNAQLAVIVGGIVVLTLTIVYLLLRRIRGPLDELIQVAGRFRDGDLTARCAYDAGNEFGALARAFNRMAQSIAGQMQLRDLNQTLSARFMAANDLPAFRRTLLEELVTMTDSQMGVYYVRDRESDRFEPFASVGVDHEMLAALDGAVGEGELGRALLTKMPVHLQEIPQDSAFRFKTFAGSLPPRDMIQFPIIVGDTVSGLICLASVKPYPEQVPALLDQPWATLVGTVLANLLANDTTRRLAGQLTEQNEELQIQQEELQAQTLELRRQSEELQEQNMELEQQRLAVEEASRLKSAFLSNMSHELRTPLNSVLALSRVLRMQAVGKLSPEEVGYLEIIERNGRNLLALINDILDLAKIESGRIDLRPERFSLQRTLEDLSENMTPLAAEKGLSLEWNIPVDLPWIVSDEARVVQILQNLVGNAVKFTDSGGVRIAAESDGERVSIHVADTGIGISSHALGFIFDEFRQADESSSRRHEGTGLGLAIARKAARMLGGDITVVSESGRGSTFTLALPLAWQDVTVDGSLTLFGSATGSTRTEPSAACGSGGKPPRILLVEDTEAAVIQVRAVLQDAGYEVDVARSGEEGIAAVERRIPDGIVLDLMMPEMDGFQVLEQIRSRPDTATIPVLILTAKDLDRRDLGRLSANNVQQLVQKGDVDRASLLLKVAAMFGCQTGQAVAPTRDDPQAVERVPATPSTVADDAGPAGSSGKPRILVVEDNPDNLATVRAVLVHHFEILAAGNGVEGLRLARQERPDLILLDMALPGMDGLEVVRRLKADSGLRSIPVIALTAQAMTGDRERILDAGCDGYLSKPIDPSELVNAISGRIKE